MSLRSLVGDLVLKKNLERFLGLLLGMLPLVPACQNARPVTALRDGPRECLELERGCKAPAEAFGEPYLHCYETGTSKVSNACINYYYDCIDACRAASETIGSGGQGGESGATSGGESGAPGAGGA
jgi:hypothetical protein